MFAYGQTAANAIAVMSYLAADPSRRAASGDLLGQRNDLGLIAFLVHRDGDVGVALGLNHARRDAARRDFQPGNLGRRACRRARNGNIFGRSPRHGGTTDTRRRKRGRQHDSDDHLRSPTRWEPLTTQK